MKKYEFLNHPAELRIRVFGKTKEELFENAALALADILNQNAKPRMDTNAAKKEIIKIKSLDLNTLLVDFLNEILAHSQINKCVYEIKDLRLKIEDSKTAKLQSKLIGYPVGHFDEDIKAVTYQGVDIKPITKGTKTKNQKLKTIEWQTDLVFDI